MFLIAAYLILLMSSMRLKNLPCINAILLSSNAAAQSG